MRFNHHDHPDHAEIRRFVDEVDRLARETLRGWRLPSASVGHDDIVNETQLRAFRAVFVKGTEVDNFDAWVRKITKNLIINEGRRHRRPPVEPDDGWTPISAPVDPTSGQMERWSDPSVDRKALMGVALKEWARRPLCPMCETATDPLCHNLAMRDAARKVLEDCLRHGDPHLAEVLNRALDENQMWDHLDDGRTDPSDNAFQQRRARARLHASFSVWAASQPIGGPFAAAAGALAATDIERRAANLSPDSKARLNDLAADIRAAALSCL